MKKDFDYLFDIRKEKGREMLVLTLCGYCKGNPVELNQFKELQNEFLKHMEGNIKGCIFDLAELHYATSSLVGAIIRCFKDSLNSKCPFAMCSLQEEPREVLGILGCTEYISIFDSFSEALEFVSR